MISIQEVSTRKQKKDFIKLTDKIYTNYPNYVPLLKVDLANFMKRQHPFYQHGDAQFFLAYQQGKPVGRICAYVNQQYNNYHQDPVGFFGSFECIDSQDVANKLITHAKSWLKQRGLTKIRGPIDYYSNEPQGTLISGFDSYPPVPLAYNPPYYPKLLMNCGFSKQADLFAAEVGDFPNVLPFHKGQMFVDRVSTRHNIIFRPINMKNLKAEVKKVVMLFNEFEKVNGENFIPVTEKEAMHFTKMMKPIIDPNLVYFAEKNGEPVGFICAIPDVNELLIKIKNGNLFPSGIFKLLTLKFKKFKRLRLMLLGMLDEYQKIGLGPALSYKVLGYAKEKGYRSLDMSMLHEDNTFMLNLADRLGGKVYKTYRVFQGEIS